ncbi:hypothetical protein GOP47_0007848 [Adiantum capillus-veneris]|uniref:Uncharacterized protein n=1 Tax=Adiantum capillus-veneris TaxID=13818 RepID=A0A9D4ZIV0_ADICA|nr:hypothetical protein GOP47_0007082 [Adiantum capillus-veneris]KAI5078024.1 hypothetical protein GOP47_0007848 [Adiantum capillus-veneris]
MSGAALTKFLWNHHKLVYLRPANAADFELLDVLVKIKQEGIFRNRPVLMRVGSIFGVAGHAAAPNSYQDAQPDLEEEEDDDDEEEEEDEVTLEALKQELQELRSRGSSGFRGKHIHIFFHGQRWRFTGGVSVALEASASDIASVGGAAGAGKLSIINNVESESVDIPALAKCLSSEANPWTPNIKYIQQWFAPRDKTELELWVVTKLVFHSGIQFGDNAEARAQVGAISTLIPVKFGARVKKWQETGIDAGAAPSAGGSVSVDNLHPTSWIPFAYQAIRLRYSLPDAKLTNPRLHMGTRRPAMRKGGREDVIADPDNEPLLNMGELLDMEAWDSLEITSECGAPAGCS